MVILGPIISKIMLKRSLQTFYLKWTSPTLYLHDAVLQTVISLASSTTYTPFWLTKKVFLSNQTILIKSPATLRPAKILRNPILGQLIPGDLILGHNVVPKRNSIKYRLLFLGFLGVCNYRDCLRKVGNSVETLSYIERA